MVIKMIKQNLKKQYQEMVARVQEPWKMDTNDDTCDIQ